MAGEKSPGSPERKYKAEKFFDKKGNLLSETLEDGTQRFYKDGKLETEKFPTGAIKYYDSNENLVRHTNWQGKEVRLDAPTPKTHQEKRIEMLDRVSNPDNPDFSTPKIETEGEQKKNEGESTFSVKEIAQKREENKPPEEKVNLPSSALVVRPRPDAKVAKIEKEKTTLTLPEEPAKKETITIDIPLSERDSLLYRNRRQERLLRNQRIDLLEVEGNKKEESSKSFSWRRKLGLILAGLLGVSAGGYGVKELIKFGDKGKEASMENLTPTPKSPSRNLGVAKVEKIDKGVHIAEMRLRDEQRMYVPKTLTAEEMKAEIDKRIKEAKEKFDKDLAEKDTAYNKLAKINEKLADEQQQAEFERENVELRKKYDEIPERKIIQQPTIPAPAPIPAAVVDKKVTPVPKAPERENFYSGGTPLRGPGSYGGGTTIPVSPEFYTGGTESKSTLSTPKLDQILLERVEIVQDNNLYKIFPTADALKLWMRIQNKSVTAFLNKKIDKEYELLGKHLKKLQEVSGLSPKLDETVKEFKERALKEAAKQGKLAQVTEK